MRYRETASFGRRQEYVVMAKLLKRGFDVYNTLVDDQGIDCIIRLSESRYLDIQIKARSKAIKHPRTFAALKISPRGNYFFIFYTECDDHFWIIPSQEVVDLGSINKAGANKDSVTLNLPKGDSDPKWQRFAQFRDDVGFESLRSSPIQ